MEENSRLPEEDVRSENMIEMRGITKRFPGVLANDAIDFSLRRNEIHCLLGENGSGKTTLMNILYGLYSKDSGTILVNGREVSITKPGDAIALGIGMVHQFFTLIPRLTVLDNIILGHEPGGGLVIDREQARKDVSLIATKMGIEIDLETLVDELSAGQKQQSEILKVLYRGAKTLIMDEPTSVLTTLEKDDLMKTLKRMTQEGTLSIIFITHKLPEAIALGDRTTVLRKGSVVGTYDNKGLDEKGLARKMLGREMQHISDWVPSNKGEVLLRLEHLSVNRATGEPALRDTSLSVCAGEILGIAGVSGSGQRPLIDSILGIEKPGTGKVFIGKDEIEGFPTHKIRSLGIAYIPEERTGRGLLQGSSISDNLVLGFHNRPPYAKKWLHKSARNWLIDQAGIDRRTEELVKEYRIEAPSLDTPVKKLSGGNRLRLILARELSSDPRVILAENPTSGLDVSSQQFIHDKLIRERDKGKAILMVSEDVDELLEMSDRIAVMYEGRIVATVLRETASREEIGRLMAGLV